MDIKELHSAIEQIAEEKDLPREKVLETVALALAAAYKKEYGRRGQKIVAELKEENLEKASIYLEKVVLTEDLIKKKEDEGEADDEDEDYEAPEHEPAEDLTEYDTKKKSRLIKAAPEESEKLKEKQTRFKPQRHIMLDEAQKMFKEAAGGDKIFFPLVFKAKFGRIAAQTAKQVIIQNIREAERDMALSEFKGKENAVVNGLVQRIEFGTVYIDLGRTTGILRAEEQPAGEVYRLQERLKCYVTKVEAGPRGPMILLSRTHPKMLQKLFELEIPEVASGVVQVKGIAREAGSRSKVAVASTEAGVDPIGACVGQKGTRISTITNEFNGEKIDIIKWDESQAQFIANSLAPAKVLAVDLIEAERKATAWVNDDQQSLAIGKSGQNVRLAAKLSGWKIDIRVKPESQTVQDAVAAARQAGDTKDSATQKEEKAEAVPASVKTPKEEPELTEIKPKKEPKKKKPASKPAKKSAKSKS